MTPSSTCLFHEVCKNYTKECDVKLLLQCPHYHTHQLISFTKKFQETFLCRLAKPTLYEKSLCSGTPVYAYTHQALYNAIMTELRFLCKYSYVFLPAFEVVTRAMAEQIILESLVIVSAEHRTVSDAFLTPFTESLSWCSLHKPTFVLLPKSFTQVPSNWKRAY